MTGSGESHPSRMSLRAILVSVCASLIVLWAGGGSIADGSKLLTGILPVGMEQDGWVHVLLGPVAITSVIVLLALLIGSSLGFAVALLAVPFGKVGRGLTSWIGRACSSLPLMALALAAIYLLLQRWDLTVESLFPIRSSLEGDNIYTSIARWTWYLMAPAVLLSIPVFGKCLTRAVRALGILKSSLLQQRLKARGIRRSLITHHHLIPLLRSTFASTIRPMMALSLVWAIPVEEIFRVDGWGAYMAKALRSADAYSLAAGLLLGGILTAVWYLLPAVLESQHGKPARLNSESKRSWLAAAIGTVAVLSLFASSSLSSSPLWRQVMQPATSEIGIALLLGLLAITMVISLGLLACLIHPQMKVKHGGMSATLCCAPVWVFLLSMAVVDGNNIIILLLIAGGVALPEMARHREFLRRMHASEYAQASISLGSSSFAFWLNHGLRVQWPSIGRLFFKLVSQVILWRTLFSYYGSSSPGHSSWGGQMQQAASDILDNPVPALLPGLCAVLWCLSFQLIARGFPVSEPSTLEPIGSRP